MINLSFILRTTKKSGKCYYGKTLKKLEKYISILIICALGVHCG